MLLSFQCKMEIDEVNTLRQEKQKQRLMLVFFINDGHNPELTVIQILIWRWFVPCSWVPDLDMLLSLYIDYAPFSQTHWKNNVIAYKQLCITQFRNTFQYQWVLDTSEQERQLRQNYDKYLALCAMLCRSLFVLLSFFIWPLCCLFFFELRIQITLLLSLAIALILFCISQSQVCVQ
jgi:hypothetical protein